MTRILQLTPYPTHRPRHGGQIRAAQTAQALQQAGYQVLQAAIYRASHYPGPIRPTIDLDNAAWTSPHAAIWQMGDLTNGAILANDPACYAAFERLLADTDADLVMLEEPWLWPALRRWREARTAAAAASSGGPRLLFNAYNVETLTKRRILDDAQVPGRDGLVAEVEALERSLVAEADAVSTVSDGDARVIRGWTDRPVVTAPNGASRRPRTHLDGILPEPLQPWWRYGLFVGSAHPPNFRGFAELLVDALSALRSDERIVVAGAVANLIRQGLAPVEGLSYMLKDRLVLLGEVSDFALDCLFCNASAVLLPITYGGGSNLKTAEALLSGRPVIATPTALRGFESFADLAGVTLAEDVAGFARALRRALDGQAAAVPSDPRLKDLLWEHTLSPIVAQIGRLIGPAAGARPLKQVGAV